MNTKRPLRKDGILSRKVGDEWMLYDTEKGSISIINTMAEFVWKMCDGSHNLSEIEQHVRDAYLVPDGANVREDLEDIIHAFANIGILNYEEA